MQRALEQHARTHTDMYTRTHAPHLASKTALALSQPWNHYPASEMRVAVARALYQRQQTARPRHCRSKTPTCNTALSHSAVVGLQQNIGGAHTFVHIQTHTHTYRHNRHTRHTPVPLCAGVENEMIHALGIGDLQRVFCRACLLAEDDK